jgi:predicted nucleotidyltransferase
VTAKRFAKVLKKHTDVNQLILFGSRARGDNFITSYYDFILVSEGFSGKPFITRASQLYNLWQSNCDLEVLCYTPEEWHRLKRQARYPAECTARWHTPFVRFDVFTNRQQRKAFIHVIPKDSQKPINW